MLFRSCAAGGLAASVPCMEGEGGGCARIGERRGQVQTQGAVPMTRMELAEYARLQLAYEAGRIVSAYEMGELLRLAAKYQRQQLREAAQR